MNLHELMPVGLALRTLRTLRHPHRGLTLLQAATVLGVSPRYLELLEEGRAPLWPEVAQAALQAYCATERERALITLTAATIEAVADWLAQQRAGGPREGA